VENIHVNDFRVIVIICLLCFLLFKKACIFKLQCVIFYYDLRDFNQFFKLLLNVKVFS